MIEVRVPALLAQIWTDYVSFRRAIDRLVSEYDKIDELEASDLDDPVQLEAKLAARDEHAMELTSALLVLRDDAKSESAESTIDHLRQLYSTERRANAPEFTSEIQARLSRILHVDEDKARKEYIASIKRAALPTYLFSRSFVDGRVVPVKGDDVVIAPIAILRITVDEPLTSHDTVTFQIDADGVEDLKLEIARIESLTQRLRDRLDVGRSNDDLGEAE